MAVKCKTAREFLSVWHFAYHRRNQSGHAYVELALVFPIIILIAFGGLEFSRSLRYVQVATMLSREAASVAFRDCIWERDPLRAQTCLEDVRTRLGTFADSRFEGAEIILSLYQYDGSQEPCDDVVVRTAIVGERNFRSKFGITASSDQGSALIGQDTIQLDKQVLCNNRALLISEVYLPYESIVGTIPNFLSYNPEEFYGVAIM